MRCLKLILSYDGTRYAGWQAQRTEDTIQGRLEQALLDVTGEQRRTIASGRTDAGVHAWGQVVSARTDCTLACDVFVRALNASLPKDIRVLSVEEAPVDFHAIRDAVRKRYRYMLQDGRVHDVFCRNFIWFVPGPLDDAAMSQAASYLVGTHDFASFQSAGSPRTSTVRTVHELSVVRETLASYSRIVVEVEADGFLYNMVRIIAGTLMRIGRGKHPPEWMLEVLEQRDRRAAGPTAPPHGLFLVSVKYKNSPVVGD